MTTLTLEELRPSFKKVWIKPGNGEVDGLIGEPIQGNETKYNQSTTLKNRNPYCLGFITFSELSVRSIMGKILNLLYFSITYIVFINHSKIGPTDTTRF